MIQKTNPARPIAWFILIIGLIAVVIALLSQNQDRIASFLVSQVLVAGVIFVVVGVILLLLLRPIEIAVQKPATATPTPTPPRPAPKPVQQAPVIEPATPAAKPVDPAKPAEPDDLTLIEGIGPKSAQALYDAGVKTFAQVAQMAPEELYRIVKVEANVQIVGKATTTWPKQAQYLVRGDTEGLKAFQDYLISGRDATKYDPTSDA